MAQSYSVKVNRRDGVVEVTGDDKTWVDAKLKELAPIWSEPPSEKDDGASDASRKRSTPQTDTGASEGGGTTDTPRKRQRKSGGERVERNEELAAKLTAAVRAKLEKHVKARRAAYDKLQPNQAAIIATFLQDDLSIKTINASQLYTVYSVMGWPGPGGPRATLENARRRQNFFSVRDGNYTLTHTGERYGRHDSLNSAQSE